LDAVRRIAAGDSDIDHQGHIINSSMMAANRAQQAGHTFEQVAEATILAAKKRKTAYKENDTQTLIEIDRMDRYDDAADKMQQEMERSRSKKDARKGTLLA
jgi:tetrahydrodipicolinate N-succinyltransferase